MKEKLCCYTKRRSNKAANLSGVLMTKVCWAIESSAD
jgi:hypothetical protein